MDGYHLYREELSEEGIRFRGAPFTFNFAKFKKDLLALKQNKKGDFPSFDHALKDPKENAININESHQIIIIEGLYLFLEEWDLNNIFDMKIFIDIEKEKAFERLA